MILIDKNSKGFTLVELMIVLVISSIIMTAIISTYVYHQKISVAQEQVTEMQQNIRAVMNLLAYDIREAGHDPHGATNANINQAGIGRISFTMDVTNGAGTATRGNGSLGDPEENVTYGFSAADDADNDGVADSGAAVFTRTSDPDGGGMQTTNLADNIQAVEFLYTLEDGSQVTNPASPQDIRSITVSLLARAGRGDPKFTNTLTYRTASGNNFGGPFNDNFRRRLLITNIQCRNMGN